MKNPYPFAHYANAMQMTYMMLEAHSVITMRVLGMAGMWSVTPAEDARMVSEKTAAMVRSSSNAGRAMLRGASLDEITAAAIKPYRQKTRANAKRLGSRGLKRS